MTQGFSVSVRKVQFGATNTVKTNEFSTGRFQSVAIGRGPFPIAHAGNCAVGHFAIGDTNAR
jgi:hypothetical protein